MNSTIAAAIDSEIFSKEYATVTDGDKNWQNLKFPTGDTYQWERDSTYIRKAPYFDGMPAKPAPVTDIKGARVLAVLGDSVTTDHISPAGSIKLNGPAGKYLVDHGVKPTDFNSYGSRRGNHEVMVRGTFANVRLRNKLAPGTEGGVTRLLPEGEGMSIFDASVKYAERGTPLVILAGKEYGSGSSRDWAAKGPRLLGVRAVIAQSYERIHRSNLVGMGILPLQFESGQSAESLGLTGEEVFDLEGIRQMLEQKFSQGRTLTVKTTDCNREEGPVQRNRAHRHAAGDFVLRERRHPAVRVAATGCELEHRLRKEPEVHLRPHAWPGRDDDPSFAVQRRSAGETLDALQNDLVIPTVALATRHLRISPDTHLGKTMTPQGHWPAFTFLVTLLAARSTTEISFEGPLAE